MYREWHKNFMPTYQFDYFLVNLAKLGKSEDIKTFMETARQMHKDDSASNHRVPDVPMTTEIPEAQNRIVDSEMRINEPREI